MHIARVCTRDLTTFGGTAAFCDMCTFIRLNDQAHLPMIFLGTSHDSEQSACGHIAVDVVAVP